jgi:biopolymer transport protein ExbB/TolQ
MNIVDLFLNYLTRSNAITIFVMAWLSFYFILTFWIFIARFLSLGSMISKERESMQTLLMGLRLNQSSILKKCESKDGSNEKMMDVCLNFANEESTKYLSFLSVIASTSPFIGLFGTVVSILETFGKMGKTGSATLSIIAPAISEALVATAGGILVAIPAYSAHILLKRRAYTLISIIKTESDLILSSSNKDESTPNT